MLKNLMTPFDGSSVRLLALLQLSLMFIVWCVVPSKILPTPLEVWNAWDSLALNNGLILELSRSAMVITKALIYSTIISAGIAYAAALNVFKPLANSIATLRFLGFAGITFVFTMLAADGSALKVLLLTFGMTVFLLTNLLSVTYLFQIKILINNCDNEIKD
jgi:NitT/TauT family transport system permease protein